MVTDGNKCDKGRDFSKKETANPVRILTTTVRTKFPGVPVISVKTESEIPKDKLMTAMGELSEVVVGEELSCGDTIVEDIAKTGVSVIVTSAALMDLGAELENKNVELNRRGSSGSPNTETSSDTGIGIVRNTAVLEDIGADAAGGFVGAAGEAVGVEDAIEEEESAETPDSGAPKKQKGRPHITRR